MEGLKLEIDGERYEIRNSELQPLMIENLKNIGKEIQHEGSQQKV